MLLLQSCDECEMMDFAIYLLPALATLQTSGDVELETTAAVHYVPDTYMFSLLRANPYIIHVASDSSLSSVMSAVGS